MILNCKFNIATCNSKEKWNGIITHINVNVKIIENARKIIVRIIAHVFVRIGSICKILLIFQ